MSRYGHREHRAISIAHNNRVQDSLMTNQNPNQTTKTNHPEPVIDTTDVKPVAYDSNGQPLYATPQAIRTEPQVVHMSRAVEPVKVAVSEEVKRRHDESIARFPTLNLSDHEYVINAVRRHPIGIWILAGMTAIAVSLVLSLMINLQFIAFEVGMSSNAYNLAMIMGGLLAFLFLLGGYIAIWVYMNNRFFLTNESVIQEIQTSIFSRKEQTVSLLNIEDASFSLQGPLQHILNYGSIRLSTEGDETTYRFEFVHDPKRTIAILNNAVEAFKNGRPVEDSDLMED